MCSVKFEHISRDDMQMISHQNRTSPTPPRSPLLSAFYRCCGKNGSHHRFRENRRIVVFGAGRVGKTSIIRQFLYDKFKPKCGITVEDLYVADYNLSNGASLTLEILDTSGSLAFPAMRILSMMHGNAFLLVYSIDDMDSWNQLVAIRDDLIALRTSACPIVIVGNIFDGTERIVNRDMVDEMIEKWKCGYIECNAKENTNIVEIFEEALIQLNIQYDLSEAVCRRRRSFPMYNGNAKGAGNGLAKLIKLMKLKWF